MRNRPVHGISSTQVITNFQFTCLTSLSIQPGGPQTVGLAWPNSAGGLVLQQSPALGAPFAAVTDSANNGSKQLLATAQSATDFYRLATPSQAGPPVSDPSRFRFLSTDKPC